MKKLLKKLWDQLSEPTYTPPLYCGYCGHKLILVKVQDGFSVYTGKERFVDKLECSDCEEYQYRPDDADIRWLLRQGIEDKR
jgi:hypothetical protein